MAIRLRVDRFGLGLAAALVLSAVPAVGFGAGSAVGAEQDQAASSAPALTVEQARTAATQILDAVQRRDANARFAQFSPELQAVTSPSMIAATMRTQPKVLRYRLLSVQSGISTSTVEADLTTTAGQRTIFIVLNGSGRIVRYYVDRIDDPSSKVADQFVRAISSGNFITAQSFLSPDFQKEITPQALQDKWFNLQRLTGPFVKVGRVVEAEHTPDARLVLVNVQFTRLSDNLFVILNNANQITGLDFPTTPQVTGSVR